MFRRATWVLGLLAVGVLAGGLGAARGPRKRPAAKKPGPRKDRPKGPDMRLLLKLYEARKHHSVRGALPYRLMKPAGYSAARMHPMVVCLHGVPGRGKDNTLQLGCTYPLAALARPEMRRRYPCLVLAPQTETWWGDQPYGSKSEKASGGRFPAMTLLIECVQTLKTTFSVDPNRVYLTGHAMGGFGAFNVLKHDPNTYAAAAIVSGGGDTKSAWRFAHVPIWVFAGEKSPILHYSQEMVAALKAVGGTPKFTVVKGAPTACWPQVYDGEAMWTWLFYQRRVIRRPPTTQPATQPTTQPTTKAAAKRP